MQTWNAACSAAPSFSLCYGPEIKVSVVGSLLRRALTAPSSHLKLVPGVRQLGGNSPKLGMLGRQNLGILLQLFRRTLDVRDHTYMHVNAHSCLHVCTHAHSYTELKKHGHGYVQQKQVHVTSGHLLRPGELL